MTALLGLVFFVIDRISGVPATADSLMTLVLFALGIVSWVLLKFRRYDDVIGLLVVFLFGMAALSAWLFGSVRTVNIVQILMGQVVAGIFLSRRGLLWTTLAAITLMGLLTWADAAGVLPGTPNFAVTWRTWMTQSASLLGVAAMMYLSRTQINRAQEMHLQEAVQRLQIQLDRDIGQERFSKLFRASPTPIFVQSARTGAILDVNRAFEQVLGYSRQEVLNQRDGFLWLRDAQYAAFSQDRRNSLRTDWHPITAIGRNGQHISLQICSEREEGIDEGLRITAIRVPGSTAGALPTVHAPLKGVSNE